MRKLIFAVLVLGLLPTAAFSQQQKGPVTVRTDSEKQNDAEIDKAYQSTLRRTKDQAPAAKLDPWQTIRSTAGNTQH